MTPALPPDILAIIDWLVEQARAYRGRLQSLEANGFKSDLMLRPDRWLPDRVPPAAFRQACIGAGLSSEDIRQAGRLPAEAPGRAAADPQQVPQAVDVRPRHRCHRPPG